MLDNNIIMHLLLSLKALVLALALALTLALALALVPILLFTHPFIQLVLFLIPFPILRCIFLHPIINIYLDYLIHS